MTWYESELSGVIETVHHIFYRIAESLNYMQLIILAIIRDHCTHVMKMTGHFESCITKTLKIVDVIYYLCPYILSSFVYHEISLKNNFLAAVYI
jgi:hypothetical protein